VKQKEAIQLMIKRCVVILSAAVMYAGICMAQGHDASSIGASDDCTDISIDFRDNPNLTRQEKEALMEQALRDSLNRYDRCQDAHKRAAGGGAAGGGGSAAGSDHGGSGESAASANMKGTNSPVEEHVENQDATAKTVDEQPPSGNKAAQKQTRGKRLPGSGKLPEDIPPADNDSVLEEQIRQAAINETDPAIKQKLWNEYRRYKGLPAVGGAQGQ